MYNPDIPIEAEIVFHQKDFVNSSYRNYEKYNTVFCNVNVEPLWQPFIWVALQTLYLVLKSNKRALKGLIGDNFYNGPKNCN